MFTSTLSPPLFQPTLPARGATLNLCFCSSHVYISTHAPRTGSDCRPPRSSDALHGFQPTLPARGATFPGSVAHIPYKISTHAPRTGSDHRVRSHHQLHQLFQPTLPARGATSIVMQVTADEKFQPTLPARGATSVMRTFIGANAISTHAPRTGSDHPRSLQDLDRRHFNPRSPHGERPPGMCGSAIDFVAFQPTLPARGATALANKQTRSIHNFNPRSPHGERPCYTLPTRFRFAYFNPRSPHGERPYMRIFPSALEEISTHAPRTGSDYPWLIAFTR